jgi:hypothetical protein
MKSVRPHIRDLVSVTNRLLDFPEIRDRSSLQKKLFNRREFRENLIIDSYTILKGVNKILPCFLQFS